MQKALSSFRARMASSHILGKAHECFIVYRQCILSHLRVKISLAELFWMELFYFMSENNSLDLLKYLLSLVKLWLNSLHILAMLSNSSETWNKDRSNGPVHILDQSLVNHRLIKTLRKFLRLRKISSWLIPNSTSKLVIYQGE